MIKKVARWAAKLAAILTLGKSFFVLAEHSLAEHYLVKHAKLAQELGMPKENIFII